jgi:hypothetical protein
MILPNLRGARAPTHPATRLMLVVATMALQMQCKALFFLEDREWDMVMKMVVVVVGYGFTVTMSHE